MASKSKPVRHCVICGHHQLEIQLNPKRYNGPTLWVCQNKECVKNPDADIFELVITWLGDPATKFSSSNLTHCLLRRLLRKSMKLKSCLEDIQTAIAKERPLDDNKMLPM